MPKPLIRNIFILFFTIISHGFSQQETFFSEKEKTLPFKLLKDTDTYESLEELLSKSVKFQSLEEFINEKTKPSHFYWVQIDFKTEFEKLEKDSIWFLKFKNFDYGSLFKLNKHSEIVEDQIGIIEAKESGYSWLPVSIISFDKTSLINNRFLYLKVKRTSFFENINSWKFAYINKKTKNDIIQNNAWELRKPFVPAILFAGACIIIFTLTIGFYIHFRQLQYLCYASYVFWLVLFLCGNTLQINQFVFGNNQLAFYWFYQILQVLMNISYVSFILYYLNTAKNYRTFHVALKIILGVLVSMFVFSSLFIVLGKFGTHLHLMNFHRFIMFLFGVYGIIYLLIYNKNRLAYFIVLGSTFYMLGALGHIFLKSHTLMISGVSLEILIFAFGLTYKMLQEHQDKIKFQQEAYVNKTKALRAQINPHFIFNSLSSIQSFITSNNKVSALKYLSKFSRLTRNILESSIETNVVLDDEIKMLKDYLELESLRFDNAFSYHINIDKDIDVKSVEVPFMILQPFVENAIIHGLLPKKEGIKELTLSFIMNTNHISCEIEDNGIGREAASKKQHIHKKEKKSRGMEVTKNRLQTISNNDVENNIEIIDKIDEKNNALGTKIIIKIPI